VTSQKAPQLLVSNKCALADSKVSSLTSIELAFAYIRLVDCGLLRTGAGEAPACVRSDLSEGIPDFSRFVVVGDGALPSWPCFAVDSVLYRFGNSGSQHMGGLRRINAWHSHSDRDRPGRRRRAARILAAGWPSRHFCFGLLSAVAGRRQSYREFKSRGGV
jgi:hypothetical protein